MPRLKPANIAFWTGGARGELLIQRCDDCRRWTHPPTDGCAFCRGRLTAEPVSGFGTVFTFTVNHHRFHPHVPTPLVIAIVELAEQTGLRLPTNVVNCDHRDVRCDLPVRVRFEQHGSIFIPLFEPTNAVDRR